MATHKTKRKKKSRRGSLIGSIVTAGVVLPLTFTAVKKGAETLPAFGRGLEGLGNIGSK